MIDAAENRPDQPADHLAAAAAPDTLEGPLKDPTPHPWARYWAKMIDLGAFLVLALIVMSMLGWNGESLDIWAWALWVTVFPLAEALLIAVSSGTPGKAVFGIKITDAQARKLGLKAAILRSYGALVVGSALSLPLLSFVANIFAYRAYGKTGLTRWDRQAGASVRARPTGKSWIVLCIILLVAFIFGFLFISALLLQQ
jgi:uncharacterized RDD family membrane protein YckC